MYNTRNRGSAGIPKRLDSLAMTLPATDEQTRAPVGASQLFMCCLQRHAQAAQCFDHSEVNGGT